MTDAAPARPALDPSALEGLAPTWRVEVVAEAGSTNAMVADRARSGAGQGLVVAAEHQRSGRGRLDRSWTSPPYAALTFSALLTPRVPARRWPWLPLLAGLATAEAVERVTGVRCELKWPNDLLAEERKLAGLLVERVERADGPAAVVGIGLNVTTLAEELPVPTATSLWLAGATELDRSRLLRAVLVSLGERYRGWTEAGGDPLAGLQRDYAARCATLGRRVRVDLPAGERLEGWARAIDADGGLEVASARGAVRVRAGDVVHVRPG